MSATVREKVKGSGVWYLFINIRGKRKSCMIGRDKKLAVDICKKIKAKLVLGEYDIEEPKNEIPTVKEYSQVWLEGNIKGLRRIATYERYKGILDRYVNPNLGNIRLDEFKKSDAKTLLIRLYKGGQSKSSVSLVNHVLSSLFNYAIDEELVQTNPVSGLIRQLKLSRSKRIEIEPLDFQEVSLFLRTCLDKYPVLYPLFLTAFRTGMRLGELLALEWKDVDWNSHFIWVKRSYKTGVTGETKSGKWRRVDVSDQLYEVLLELHTLSKAESVMDGNGEDAAGLIFNRNGKHLEQDNTRKTFKKILRAAGIREMRFHDTRHTYASQLLTKGFSPVYVKEQLGHHSIKITVDTYGHLIPNSNKTAVNSLDDSTLLAPICTQNENQIRKLLSDKGLN